MAQQDERLVTRRIGRRVTQQDQHQVVGMIVRRVAKYNDRIFLLTFP